MIDDLEARSTEINRELRAGGADHPYVPLLLTAPGIGWVLAYTIAAEIGDITRFRSPRSCAATPASARASTSPATPTAAARCQSTAQVSALGDARSRDARLRHPAYRDRYQRNKRRLGKQRGAKVAQIDIARRLTEAIWHMLTRNQPFAPLREAPLFVWPPDGPFGIAPPEPASNVPGPPARRR